MPVKPIPDGYRRVTPYLCIKGAGKVIEFYKQAFNAAEVFRLVAPNGDIGHPEMMIGNSMIMSADECGKEAFRSPTSLGASSIGLYIYVQDVDALFAQAVHAGAKIVKTVEDQFYGDRNGTLEDLFGHT